MPFRKFFLLCFVPFFPFSHGEASQPSGAQPSLSRRTDFTMGSPITLFGSNFWRLKAVGTRDGGFACMAQDDTNTFLVRCDSKGQPVWTNNLETREVFVPREVFVSL